jgi:hypothetical protein
MDKPKLLIDKPYSISPSSSGRTSLTLSSSSRSLKKPRASLAEINEWEKVFSKRLSAKSDPIKPVQKRATLKARAQSYSAKLSNKSKLLRKFKFTNQKANIISKARSEPIKPVQERPTLKARAQSYSAKLLNNSNVLRNAKLLHQQKQTNEYIMFTYYAETFKRITDVYDQLLFLLNTDDSKIIAHYKLLDEKNRLKLLQFKAQLDKKIKLIVDRGKYKFLDDFNLLKRRFKTIIKTFRILDA